MDFETFIQQKRIHAQAFREQRPALWEQFQSLYQQIGPKSFDLQKKFYFNDLRALFPLPPDLIPVEPTKPAKPKLARPKLRSKADTSGEAKPKLARPTMKKPATEAEEAAKPTAKPKLAKPKLAKPVLKKPQEESSEEEMPVRKKPKLAKPVMKPKASESEDDDGSEGESK